MSEIRIRRADNSWGPAEAWLREVDRGLGTEAARAQALSLVLGAAARRRGAVDAVKNFGSDELLRWIEQGETADPVIEAFFTRLGELREDRLRRAAELLLAEEGGHVCD